MCWFARRTGGYWAQVPALPGCFSQGDDLEEAPDRVAEAIRCHVEALVLDGDAVPANVARVEVDPEVGAEVVVRLVSVEGLATSHLSPRESWRQSYRRG